MRIDPLGQQVGNHQHDLLAAAHRRAQVRAARRARQPAGGLRATTARLLLAAAARLERPAPAPAG